MRGSGGLAVAVSMVCAVSVAAAGEIVPKVGPTGITGTVNPLLGGSPLDGVRVVIYDEDGLELETVQTDSSGEYVTSEDLDPGPYYVRTVGTPGHIDQLWDAVDCPVTCDPLSGTAVVVTTGSMAQADFLLPPGVSISGSVTSSTVVPDGIAGARVWFSDDGGLVAETATSADGSYDSGVAFNPVGTYFVQVVDAPAHLAELYDDISCPFESSCVAQDGDPVAPDGSDVSGIDFTLEPGAVLSGTVVDAGEPESGVADAVVNLYSAEPVSFLSSTTTDADGSYAFAPGIPPGDYHVYAQLTPEPYIPMLWDGLSCPGCFPEQGDPLVISSADPVTADFALEQWGAISGAVTGNDTGLGLENVDVVVFDENGDFFTNASTDADGLYTTAQELLPGTYYVVTDSGADYLDELYDGERCDGGCDVVGSGTPVAVTSGATTGGIDFGLDRGGSIAGQVIDQGTFEGLEGVLVGVYDETGAPIPNAVDDTDENGFYQIPPLLWPGSYYAVTVSGGNLLDEVYDGIICEGCDLVAVGTPIAVGVGEAVEGINFQLAPGGEIAGRVTDESGVIGLEDVDVGIYDSNGDQVAAATTDGSGDWITAANLPPGLYSARTFAASPYLNELYQELECGDDCDPLNGTPIPVTQGPPPTGDIDFTLAEGGSISGSAAEAPAMTAIAGLKVLVYDAAGGVVTGAISEGDGRWTTGPVLPAGSYFVATVDNPVHLDELWQGLACEGGCDVTTGTGIAVTAGDDSSGIDFELEIDPFIFSDGFESGDTGAWSG